MLLGSNMSSCVMLCPSRFSFFTKRLVVALRVQGFNAQKHETYEMHDGKSLHRPCVILNRRYELHVHNKSHILLLGLYLMISPFFPLFALPFPYQFIHPYDINSGYFFLSEAI